LEGEQSAHRRSVNPSRRRHRKSCGGGSFFHAATGSKTRPGRSARKGSPKILVPEQLDLVGKFSVGRAIDGSQHKTVPLVEVARGNIHVLRFDLQLPATFRDSPRFSGP